jgi:hypothetical protein
MPNYRVRLVCPVRITASVEFKMEAEDFDKAHENAIEEFEKQSAEYQEKLDAYHKTHNGGYPEAPFYWSTDDDDIEGNIDDDDIEIDTIDEDV